MTSSVLPRAVLRDYWSGMTRQWNLLGEPLRPGEQDLRFYEAAVRRIAGTQRQFRATILGVTPELFRLAWPPGTRVSAIDRAQGMIDAIWPGPPESAYCGDWTDMPFETASRDIVLCDGGAITLTYPEGLTRLSNELHRVLAPAGLIVIRTFVRPAEVRIPAGDRTPTSGRLSKTGRRRPVYGQSSPAARLVQGTRRESACEVLADLWSGNVPNTNVLKLRLGMALQDDVNCGVSLAEIWSALHDSAPDLDQLAEQIGFVPEQLRAIDAYRDCSNRYSFHSLHEFLLPFVESPGGFTVAAVHTPTYVLGDRCPTIRLRRDSTPHVESASDVCTSVVRPPHFEVATH